MHGIIYRIGRKLKDAGERRRWPALIRLGLGVMGIAAR